MILPGNHLLPFATAQDLVRKYRASTVHLFDGDNPSPHDVVRPADVTAIAALNALGGAEPARTLGNLWDARERIQVVVAPIPTAPLHTLTPEQRSSTATLLDIALSEIQSINGAGGNGVVASKFLHRLRPNVCPIWDVRAGAAWYPSYRRRSWSEWIGRTYELVLAEPTFSELERLQREDGVQVYGVQLPILRMWDILLWSWA